MNSTDRRRLAGLKSFGNRPQELSFISSDRDPFDFVERDLIAGMVIEFPDYALPSVTKRLVADQGFCGIS